MTATTIDDPMLTQPTEPDDTDEAPDSTDPRHNDNASAKAALLALQQRWLSGADRHFPERDGMMRLVAYADGYASVMTDELTVLDFCEGAALVVETFDAGFGMDDHEDMRRFMCGCIEAMMPFRTRASIVDRADVPCVAMMWSALALNSLRDARPWLQHALTCQVRDMLANHCGVRPDAHYREQRDAYAAELAKHRVGMLDTLRAEFPGGCSTMTDHSTHWFDATATPTTITADVFGSVAYLQATAATGEPGEDRRYPCVVPGVNPVLALHVLRAFRVADPAGFASLVQCTAELGKALRPRADAVDDEGAPAPRSVT